MHNIYTQSEPLLSVHRLKTHFQKGDELVKAVDGIDLTIHKGEAFGLVGESGCGKTVAALSILRLMSRLHTITEGTILFHGTDLMCLSEEELNRLRGNRIALIFQEPHSSLYPAGRIGDQITSIVQIHSNKTKAECRLQAIELLRRVGLPDPNRQALAYPHQLSIGMAQRAMIALALACQPDLLIADEPTSALDATMQAEFFSLLREIRRESNLALLLIAHDLAVVATNANRVAVMYAGQIIEESPASALLSTPLHPYTRALAAARPKPGQRAERLNAIPGAPPDPVCFPQGCRFAPRCSEYARLKWEVCIRTMPELLATGSGSLVRCWLYEQDKTEKKLSPAI
jgi:peptide/nickel transport system ATP-binding protein